jgi:hypothetical protein
LPERENGITKRTNNILNNTFLLISNSSSG